MLQPLPERYWHKIRGKSNSMIIGPLSTNQVRIKFIHGRFIVRMTVVFFPGLHLPYIYENITKFQVV